YGVSVLCGIGFTMSLFIGNLAFAESPLLVDEVKVGVLAGSVLAALAGMLILRFSPSHPSRYRSLRSVDSSLYKKQA
ncbi:Na+/H+ antiporter NhaA, partial [Citrobacter freundii]|nr:Na+/H+ antiporter NhaA [Citrobacter freundii]